MRVMNFEQWLSALDEAAKKRGYVGDSMVKGTGADCWRGYYDDGLSPANALSEDESNA